MIKLIVQSGPIRGQVFVPPPGVPVEIGRGEACFVCIEGQDVSRRHAVLVPSGFDYVIQDLDSMNGTFVNGKEVEKHRLRSGDTIRIGKTEISFVREEADPWVGRTLGGCRILERIGRGGMGTVYRADQLAMQRAVAVKILSEELSQDEMFVASFVREARAMAKLSHANVVQVHNVGSQDGVYYLSMEYVAGGTVKALIERDGQLPPRRAIELAIDAARALVWAEQHGIVHRDIKPGNLLLDSAGSVKVADFGLAADLRRGSALTEGGRIVGSPPYMAPEQARGEVVDHRADLYALGSSLYTMLAGRSPFRGKTVHEVLNAKLTEDPAPLWELAPDSPRRLCEIVARCMEREPPKRYAHAIELLRELSEIRASLGRPASRTEGTEAPAAPSPRDPRSARGGSRRLRWIAGAATAIGIGVGLLVAFQRPPPDPGTATPRADPSNAAASPPGAVADSTLAPSPPPGAEADAAPGGPNDREPATPLAEATPAVAAPRAEDEVQQALERWLDTRLPVLLLESRFPTAVEELEAFLQEHPRTRREIEAALRRVRSAEALFDARRRALELQREGSLDEAIATIEARLGDLDPPHRLEALAAIESIKGDKAASSR